MNDGLEPMTLDVENFSLHWEIMDWNQIILERRIKPYGFNSN